MCIMGWRESTGPHRSLWFLDRKLSNVGTTAAICTGGGMSSSFLQGTAFFALVVVVVIATFGGFGVL
jgi:hypothetical protein